MIWLIGFIALLVFLASLIFAMWVGFKNDEGRL